MHDIHPNQGEALAPRWTPESPFGDEASSSNAGEARAVSSGALNESPFASEIDERLGPRDPVAEAADELLGELHDGEFDVAVYEVVHELSSLAPPRPSAEIGESRGYEARVERLLEERLAPLGRVVEEQLDELGAELEHLDPASLSEAELESVIERTPAPHSALGPSFEFFVKKLWDKAKKVVKGAAKAVGKGVQSLGLKPVLMAFKKLVRPLLKKVLSMALDKLPERYRPHAEKVASRLKIRRAAKDGKAGSKSTAPAPATSEPAASSAATSEPAASAPADAAVADAPAAPDANTATAAAPTDPATADVGQVQSELDARVAELLLSRDEFERELSLEAEEEQALRPAADPVSELEQGREHFARTLSTLREGEDPRPALEQFVPVVLGAVKLGLKLVGRKRVIGLLGGLLGKLIAPLVGRSLGPPLGKAIADVGLKLLGLELPAAEQPLAASRAIARTVEETVRRVSALPEYALENEMLLESHALEAFEAAAAANFPPLAIRSELHEAEGVEAMWVALPARGRAYYKRYSRAFAIEIGRPIAASIRTFGGRTLEAFLRDSMRATLPVRGRAHLFEILPGGRLAHIAEHERARGLGRAAAYRSLHPLTPHAATALLRHPRLGTPFRDAPDALRPSVGDRFYFLELDEAPATPLGRASELRAHVDFPRERIRVRLHLGEPAAQSVASELRKTRRGAALVHRLRQLFAAETRLLASAHNDRVLDVTLSPPAPGDRAALGSGAERGQRDGVRKELGARIEEWTWTELARSAEQKLDDFVRATESPEHGVTLVVTFEHPPRMAAIRRLLQGARVSADEKWAAPSGKVSIFAGHRPD